MWHAAKPDILRQGTPPHLQQMDSGAGDAVDVVPGPGLPAGVHPPGAVSNVSPVPGVGRLGAGTSGTCGELPQVFGGAVATGAP
ncbi:hypothetical protein GCM10023335_51910 [Streptomyces siamensis]|uniref:Uncharacterized protein n=1 Tax=Streptomyces siamensis TaxID=1274986 RepID=A0ABP9J7L9_9ACTN